MVQPRLPPFILNFAGMSYSQTSWYPPDTEGAVGLHNYVQWVNASFSIWDRAGNLLYGPAPGNTLWSGFGGVCEDTNDGDPIVLYDQLADRWLFSQYAFYSYNGSNYGPYHQCIAVSQTSDPTGPYYLYDFVISDTRLNDAPKLAVWPDGYYASFNMYGSSNAEEAALPRDVSTQPCLTAPNTPSGSPNSTVAAFQRDAMLMGSPSAQMVCFDLGQSTDPQHFGLLPANLDGWTPPPLYSPEYFAEVTSSVTGWTTQQLNIFQFDVDWSNTANTTFTQGVTLAPAPFIPLSYCNCVSQPSGAPGLETVSDRLMYRLTFRNFADHRSLVLNHTVDVDGTGHAGIRWYELQAPAVSAFGSGSTPWTIVQQGTYGPDSAGRWMGSIAMDHVSDMALGFSLSGASTFPSIAWTGRLAGDTSGAMDQGEQLVEAGSGVQLGLFNGRARWGDYSAMAVDPYDDCTFYYTQEYQPVTATWGWSTRVAAMQFPQCTATVSGGWSPTGSLSTPRSHHTLTRLADGSILAAGGSSNWSSGWSNSAVASAEVYEPWSGAWSQTGAMQFAREFHAAALYANGKVLVAGGQVGNVSGLESKAESYDPSTHVWTSLPNMNDPREYGFTLTTLLDGRVLAAGGYSPGTGDLATAELYNPATNAWSRTGSMNVAREWHAATLLADGRVLVAGGSSNGTFAVASAETYDPSTGRWTLAPNMAAGRAYAASVTLANGNALIAGGSQLGPCGVGTAEIYNLSTNSWSSGGALLSSECHPQATLLTSGRVLLHDDSNGTAWGDVELFDPGSLTWSPAAPPSGEHAGAPLALMPNGDVLAAGGTSEIWTSDGGYGDTAALGFESEVYAPLDASSSPNLFVSALPGGSGSTVVAGGSVVATWTNVTNATTNDFVGLYQLNDPDSALGPWMYVSCSTTPSAVRVSGSCIFPMPPTPGTYQLRLFRNGSTSYRLAASVPMSVVPPPSVTADTATTGRGFSVNVSWNNQLNPSASDFIALYSQGAPDSQYIELEYVNCTSTPTTTVPSGSCSFSMPRTPGVYEFRLFGGNSISNRLAVSAAVTVVAPQCSPRAPVQLSAAVVSPGVLQVSVSKTGDYNDVESITLGNAATRPASPVNAAVSIGGQPLSGSATFAAGTLQVTMTVQQVASWRAVTVPFVVADGCGTWPTFVGGGPAAFQRVGSFYLGSGPPAPLTTPTASATASVPTPIRTLSPTPEPSPTIALTPTATATPPLRGTPTAVSTATATKAAVAAATATPTSATAPLAIAPVA